MRVLFDVLPILLVEFDKYLGPAVLLQATVDHRFARREKEGPDSSQRRVQVVQMSHDYELHQGLPERLESGQGDRKD